MDGACDTGEIRNAYRILVGKPKGKRLLGRHRRRLEDNIRLDHSPPSIFEVKNAWSYTYTPLIRRRVAMSS
jgi:hypothetical protein